MSELQRAGARTGEVDSAGSDRRGHRRGYGVSEVRTQLGGWGGISVPRSTMPFIPDEHVQAVGVRRRGYGTSGAAIQVHTNHFAVGTPTAVLYHYDGMLLFTLTSI